jgi:hypothetical protein
MRSEALFRLKHAPFFVVAVNPPERRLYYIAMLREPWGVPAQTSI